MTNKWRTENKNTPLRKAQGCPILGTMTSDFCLELAKFEVDCQWYVADVIVTQYWLTPLAGFTGWRMPFCADSKYIVLTVNTLCQYFALSVTVNLSCWVWPWKRCVDCDCENFIADSRLRLSCVVQWTSVWLHVLPDSVCLKCYSEVSTINMASKTMPLFSFQ